MRRLYVVLGSTMLLLTLMNYSTTVEAIQTRVLKTGPLSAWFHHPESADR